jgi:hypothetical protein
MDIIGKKFKPVDDPTAKEWFSCYFDEDAQAALNDITSAEPCIYISADGIFTATRLKRRLCKGPLSLSPFFTAHCLSPHHFP